MTDHTEPTVGAMNTPSRPGSRVAALLRAIWKLPILAILVLLVVLVIPALLAEQIALHSPRIGNLSARLQPPVFAGGTWEYPLGTDRTGRDILSRIIYGARVSLSVSIVGIIVGALVGTTLGLLAGFFRGWLDAVVMRMVDITLALPSLLLALALAAAIGPSFQVVILVVAFVLWGQYARQVRGEVLSIRERDYIARARVAGASNGRIIFREVLPNVANTLTVLATLQVGSMIIFEASLSFLGLGIPPPTPAWGLMVAEGRDLFITAWWISLFPGLAIMFTVLSINLLGDWLRDTLDPRLKTA